MAPHRFSATALRLALLSATCLALGACSGSPDDGSASDDTAAEELAGNPKSINIGFNGDASQFAFTDEFHGASAVQPGPRVCHTYVAWNVGEKAPGSGDVTKQGSRAWVEHWLAAAEGHCDEALISFKSIARSEGGDGNETPAKTTPPTAERFAQAFEAFRSAKWPGWTGKFAFTPWNEPNNGAGAGNGLGEALSPDLAAQYYLAARRRCENGACTVAAGDLASNGHMNLDFIQRCSSDIVAPKDLCKDASWLDSYKNYIANHANDAAYRLGKDFRPEVFAYHAWYDVNTYLAKHGHCQDEATCSTRALLRSLGGSWGGVKIWDTEIGVGQDGDDAIDDGDQACGAAFLLRLTDLSQRITRIYYTRIYGGNPKLFDGKTTRPAFSVLALRETQAPNRKCY